MRGSESAQWGISLLCLLFAVSVCSADENTRAVEVVGTAECADCKTYNIKSAQAFSGLRVSVDCKLKNGETKRIGEGDIDKDGEFNILIPQQPNQNCYAQLHSAAALPCPAHNGLDASKIVLKSQTNGQKTFGPSTNLQFSTTLCASKTFLSKFKYPPLPPLTPHPWLKNYHNWPPLTPHPWLKAYPPLTPHPWIKGYPPLAPFPPLFHHKQPPAPVYTPPVVEPLPPPAPIYTPTPVYMPPVVEPLPPPAPIYTPTPVYKPKPHVPVYKPKPQVPVYKPKPPGYKPAPEVKPLPPATPTYKPAPEVKPIPPATPTYKPAPEVKPIPPATPTYKPPCPPLPKLPHLPKFPPKYFHHPKYGFNFPPLPPHHP